MLPGVIVAQLLVHAWLGLVFDYVVGIPGSSGFGETDIRHVYGEIFAGTDGNVANPSEIHDRLVGLFLDNDRIARSTGIAVAHIVHGDHSEQIFFSLGEFWHCVHVGRYKGAINVIPFVLASLLHLNDITSNFGATVAAWRAPT